MEYCFISHTGFGGVAYAMATTCLRLQAEQQVASLSVSSSRSTDIVSPHLLANNRMVQRPADDTEAFQQGDYRDILSLTRVLASGPASKAEVDVVVDRYVHLASFQYIALVELVTRVRLHVCTSYHSNGSKIVESSVEI